MADEEILDATVEEEPQQEAQEGPQGESEEIQEVTDGLRVLFDEHVPEMSEDYDGMSVAARTKVLSLKLQEKTQAASSTADSSDKDSATEDKQGASPDFSGLETNLQDIDKFLDDYDASAESSDLKKAFGLNTNFSKSAMALMAEVVRGQDARIAELEGPRRFQDALSKAPGAAEADIPRARELFKAGDVKTEAAALRFASLERRASGSRPSDGRKTAALKASRADVGGLRAGDSFDNHIPETDEEMAEMYAREAAQK